MEEETENWLDTSIYLIFFIIFFTSDKCTYNLKIWPEELNRSKSNYFLNLDILGKNIDKYYIGDT